LADTLLDLMREVGIEPSAATVASTPARPPLRNQFGARRPMPRQMRPPEVRAGDPRLAPSERQRAYSQVQRTQSLLPGERRQVAPEIDGVNQWEEAGQMLLETTGVPQAYRSGEALHEGRYGDAAMEGASSLLALGSLGLPGVRGRAPAPRVRAPELPRAVEAPARPRARIERDGRTIMLHQPDGRGGEFHRTVRSARESAERQGWDVDAPEIPPVINEQQRAALAERIARQRRITESNEAAAQRMADEQGLDAPPGMAGIPDYLAGWPGRGLNGSGFMDEAGRIDQGRFTADLLEGELGPYRVGGPYGEVPLLGTPGIGAEPMVNRTPPGRGAMRSPQPRSMPNEDRYLFGRPPRPAAPPRPTTDAVQPSGRRNDPVQRSLMEGAQVSRRRVDEVLEQDGRNPLDGEDWGVEPITLEEVRAAMANGARRDRSWSHGDGSDWTRQDHIDRIATLARESGGEPVVLTPYGVIEDGMHRLAAAMARGDDTLPVAQRPLSAAQQRELTADPRVLEAEYRARPTTSDATRGGAATGELRDEMGRRIYPEPVRMSPQEFEQYLTDSRRNNRAGMLRDERNERRIQRLPGEDMAPGSNQLAGIRRVQTEPDGTQYYTMTGPNETSGRISISPQGVVDFTTIEALVGADAAQSRTFYERALAAVFDDARRTGRASYEFRGRGADRRESLHGAMLRAAERRGELPDGYTIREAPNGAVRLARPAQSDGGNPRPPPDGSQAYRRPNKPANPGGFLLPKRGR